MNKLKKLIYKDPPISISIFFKLLTNLNVKVKRKI